ncbi:MAG: haloacid dehalogenase-like hydrolase [Prevotellaceae bacterium]|jgi:phosphoserine phosphatase|nr:haloacid dehalogenase-like hydrolase [Prevotellaceae bacterium]
MKMMHPTKTLPTVALIYDFDGTLSPGNMQDFGFIQATGKDIGAFWATCERIGQEQDASGILTYMKVMIDEARKANIRLQRETFRHFGRQVALFNGVREWFALMNDYGRSKGVVIEHYINSSGLKEMIEGTPIAQEFKKIYACSFYYENGEAVFPAVAVDFTTKTQFLFKINKGIDSVSDNKVVNRYTPQDERPIPFARMIYFGDGETDIPCMKLVKQQGGYSIAVYEPHNDKKKIRARQLIAEDRVNFVCPADYTRESEIYRVVTTIISKMKSDAEFEALELLHRTYEL